MISFPRAAWRSTGLVVCLMAGLTVGCAAWAKSNETATEAAKDTAKPAAKDAAKGSAKGTGKDQREYFQKCVANNGKVDDIPADAPKGNKPAR